MKCVRPFIFAFQIYHALILPHFDCCSSVGDELNVTLSDKLQKLQNMAAWVITKSSYNACQFPPKFDFPGTIFPHARKSFKVILMFKAIEGLSLAYLQNVFRVCSTPYNLRDSELKLDLPKPRTNYCKPWLLPK